MRQYWHRISFYFEVNKTASGECNSQKRKTWLLLYKQEKNSWRFVVDWLAMHDLQWMNRYWISTQISIKFPAHSLCSGNVNYDTNTRPGLFTKWVRNTIQKYTTHSLHPSLWRHQCSYKLAYIISFTCLCRPHCWLFYGWHRNIRLHSHVLLVFVLLFFLTTASDHKVASLTEVTK